MRHGASAAPAPGGGRRQVSARRSSLPRALFVAGLVVILVGVAMAATALARARENAALRAEALERIGRTEVLLDASSIGPETAMPSLEVGGVEFVGSLEIAELGLELPVMERGAGSADVAPMVGSGTVYANDLVVVGGEGVLGTLGALSGDEGVVVRDTLRNEFAFEADGVERLRPTSLERALEGDDGADLTLCSLDARGMVCLVVRCRALDAA